MGKKLNFYIVSTLLLTVFLPALSIFAEFLMTKRSLDAALIGKWFIFWAIGIRLLVAGLRQATNPSFTAVKIFHFKTAEGYPVIRELGFANISIGAIGILSMMNSEWRQVAAIAGGLFYGLAGLLHFFRKPDNSNEMVAMITDLFIFSVMLLYTCFNFLA